MVAPNHHFFLQNLLAPLLPQQVKRLPFPLDLTNIFNQVDYVSFHMSVFFYDNKELKVSHVREIYVPAMPPLKCLSIVFKCRPQLY